MGVELGRLRRPLSLSCAPVIGVSVLQVEEWAWPHLRPSGWGGVHLGFTPSLKLVHSGGERMFPKRLGRCQIPGGSSVLDKIQSQLVTLGARSVGQRRTCPLTSQSSGWTAGYTGIRLPRAWSRQRRRACELVSSRAVMTRTDVQRGLWELLLPL